MHDLGGSSSLNLAFTSEGRSYVARVYRPYLTEERLVLTQGIRRDLRLRGVPCGEQIMTCGRVSQSQPFARIRERLLEVELFIATDGKMDTWERMKTGLERLGEIHSLLKGSVASGT